MAELARGFHRRLSARLGSGLGVLAAGTREQAQQFMKTIVGGDPTGAA
jgi:hypothetical protein